MNLLGTLCMVRGGSEGYGTVREGSGHFLTCKKNNSNPPNHSIRLEIRTGRISIRIVRMAYVLMRIADR